MSEISFSARHISFAARHISFAPRNISFAAHHILQAIFWIIIPIQSDINIQQYPRNQYKCQVNTPTKNKMKQAELLELY